MSSHLAGRGDTARTWKKSLAVFGRPPPHNGTCADWAYEQSIVSLTSFAQDPDQPRGYEAAASFSLRASERNGTKRLAPPSPLSSRSEASAGYTATPITHRIAGLGQPSAQHRGESDLIDMMTLPATSHRRPSDANKYIDGDNDNNTNNNDDDDDDSSVAMELYLRERISAVLSSSADDEDENDNCNVVGDHEDRVKSIGPLQPDQNERSPTPGDSDPHRDDGQTSAGSSCSCSSSSSSALSSFVPAVTPPSTTAEPLAPPSAPLCDPSSDGEGGGVPASRRRQQRASPEPWRRRGRDPRLGGSPLHGWRRGGGRTSDPPVPPPPTPQRCAGPVDDDGDSDDNDDDGAEENSVTALEGWAQAIRLELRQNELLQVAREAERAAESGAEAFAGRFSTYGRDDAALGSALPRPGLVPRSQTVSEGIRIRREHYFSAGGLRRGSTGANHPPRGLGVMELRDVDEVFPSFRHFHKHLRTHLARSGVHEQSLAFREASSLSYPFGISFDRSDHDRGDGRHRQVRSPTEFFKPPWGALRPTTTTTTHDVGGSAMMSPTAHHRTSNPGNSATKDGVVGHQHRRLPSSDLFRHNQRTTSVFLQSFSFDRWISHRNHGSTDTADAVAVVDLLADHSWTVGKPRSVPPVAVPPGLEMPRLDPRISPEFFPAPLDSPCSSRSISPASSSLSAAFLGEGRSTTKTDADQRQPTTHNQRRRARVARALFDDAEPESDGERVVVAEQYLDVAPQHSRRRPMYHHPSEITRAPVLPPSFKPFSGSYLPDDRDPSVTDEEPLPPPHPHPPPPPPPDHTDFLTPARLRVIRNSHVYNSILQSIDDSAILDQNLRLTPNSVLDSGSGGSAQQFHPSQPTEHDVDSLFIPQHIETIPSQLSPSNAADLPALPDLTLRFRARPSQRADEDPPDVMEDTLLSNSLMGNGPIDREMHTPLPHKHHDDSANDTSSVSILDSKFEQGGGNPMTDGIGQHSKSCARQRRVTVKIFGSTSDHDDSESVHSSCGGGGVLQHSQTISILDLPAGLQILDQHASDCACLALSPPCSQASACSTPIRKDLSTSPVVVKPHLMRRSSSANALSSLEQTPRGVKWNPFASSKSSQMDDRSSNSKLFHQTAMRLLSRINPKRKSPYFSPQENDDFMHNYLYCSKTTEGEEILHEPMPIMCEQVSPEICCGSFFPDSSVGMFLSNRRSAASGPILSLSGDHNQPGGMFSKLEPESWFDLDHFEFLEHFSGRGKSKSSPFNVSFQAPTLRKGESTRRLRADSIVEEEGEEAEELDQEARSDGYYHHQIVEEKKSEDVNHARNPKHARHLSYFPSRQGPQFAPTDNQFEMIYGVAPDALADALLQDLEVYQNQFTGDESVLVSTTGSDGLVHVDVAAFLAGTKKSDVPPPKTDEIDDDLDSLVAPLSF